MTQNNNILNTKTILVHAIEDVLQNKYYLHYGKLYQKKRRKERTQHLAEHLLYSLTLGLNITTDLTPTLALTPEEQVSAILGSFYHDTGKTRIGFQSYLIMNNTLSFPQNSREQANYFLHLLPIDTKQAIQESTVLAYMVENKEKSKESFQSQRLVNSITLETQLHHAKYGKAGLLQALQYRQKSIRQGLISEIIRFTDKIASQTSIIRINDLRVKLESFKLQQYFPTNILQHIKKTSGAPPQPKESFVLWFPNWMPKTYHDALHSITSEIMMFLEIMHPESLHVNSKVRVTDQGIKGIKISDPSPALLLSMVFGGIPITSINTDQIAMQHLTQTQEDKQIFSRVIKQKIMKKNQNNDQATPLLNAIKYFLFTSHDEIDQVITQASTTPIPDETLNPLQLYSLITPQKSAREKEQEEQEEQEESILETPPKTIQELLQTRTQKYAPYLQELGFYLFVKTIFQHTNIPWNMTKAWKEAVNHE